MIRQLGCMLPVQVWYLGDGRELDRRMQQALKVLFHLVPCNGVRRKQDINSRIHALKGLWLHLP